MIKAIGICGPSGSGKTTLAEMLRIKLNANVIGLDGYFLLDPPVKKYEMNGQNWELPENIDWVTFRNDILTLKSGKGGRVQKINWANETYFEESLEPKNLLIVEGFLLLYDEILSSMLDISFYLDVPDEVGIKRRLDRERNEEDRKWFEEITFPEYAKHRKLFEERANFVLNGEDTIEKNYNLILHQILKLEM